MTIPLKYSCAVCGLHRVTLDVPAREAEEAIKAWMDHTIHRVAHDHIRRSPGCGARELSELMIPITGRPQIGGPSIA